MGIVDEDVQRVRDDADIVDVIGRYVALKKTGRQFMALCPFHGEKTPSLSVSPDKGVFYCFGCQRHGDAISFVREIEGLDFVGAVEHLADRAGITLRYSEADGGRSRRRRNDILRALDMAAAFYHERLMNGSDAGPARAYLRDRGYDRETVERFRLGWAPDEWDGLHRHLSSRSGAPAPAVLDAAGLVFTNQRQRRQDSFRARVMFPISDVNDAVVGFGGRMLPGGRPPKYKNSADGEVYNKSRILYGLNWARGDIVAHDEVVVCEGYTDVIGFRRSGISRAVATCGTALTDEHVKLLTRFAHRIVLAFDADSAGRAAADRFHEWERSYDVQVYVAGLPDGTDPGELAQQDPDRLALAVEDAVPFLAYRVDRALAGGRLHEAEGRARAAEEALALVAAHPDPLVRDQYVVAVAERLGFEPGQLRHLASEPGRRGDTRVRPPTVTDHERSVAGGPEQLLLRLVVHHPSVDGGLVDPALFADPVNAAAVAALRAAPDLTAAIGSSGEAVGALLGRLAVEDVDDLVLKDPMSVVARVVILAAHRQERLLRAAQSARTLEEARAHQPTIDWVAQRVSEASQADGDGRDPAVEALVGWLRTQHAQEGGAGQ